MMNKGLEVIEAHWLFGTGREQIDIVIHPQSIIHSMVEFSDGSIKAQLGLPDMKLPIQYALTYPERVEADWEEAKFSDIGYLTFEEPDLVKFPCIRLAYEALQRGGSAPAALNVANDNSVAAFLAGEISFTEIATLNEMALVEHDWTSQPDLDFLLELESVGENNLSIIRKRRLLYDNNIGFDLCFGCSCFCPRTGTIFSLPALWESGWRDSPIGFPPRLLTFIPTEKGWVSSYFSTEELKTAS